MILCVDDVCPEYIANLKYLEELHKEYTFFSCILFTIANFKNCQPINKCKEFIDFVTENKEWVTVGVHGYDHTIPALPPEQEREDAEELVKKSLDILRPYLPIKFLYRPPGFQHLTKTRPMLYRLGFHGIAYERRIVCFDGTSFFDILNAHLTYDKYYNPIGKWRKWNELKILKKNGII